MDLYPEGRRGTRTQDGGKRDDRNFVVTTDLGNKSLDRKLPAEAAHGKKDRHCRGGPEHPDAGPQGWRKGGQWSDHLSGQF